MFERHFQGRTAKGKIDQARLDATVRKLQDETSADAIILFGSRARGDDRDDSDYDLCVVVPDRTRAGSVHVAELWSLARPIGLGIHLVVMTVSDFAETAADVNSLAHDVAQDGVVLIGSLDVLAAA